MEKNEKRRKRKMGSQSAEQKRILYAAGAYTMWGILPIY